MTEEEIQKLESSANPFNQILKTQEEQGKLIQLLLEKLNEPKVLTKKRKPKKKRKVKVTAARPMKGKRTVKAVVDEDEEIIDIDPPEPKEDEDDEVIIDVEDSDGGGDHTQARPEPLKLGNRPNRFNEFFETTKGLKSDKEWGKQLKQDKEDKKLYKGVQPLARRPKPQKYRISCDGCGKKFVVTEDLLKITVEGKSYTCNRCVVGKK